MRIAPCRPLMPFARSMVLGVALVLGVGLGTTTQARAQAPAGHGAPEPAAAAASAPAAGECIDRLRPADRPQDVPARLPELSYRCVPLPEGGQVWMGEAGSQHEHSVLLVHGLGHLAHRDWRKVIEPLAARFHVLAFDLPGFGASPTPADGGSFSQLAGLLDTLVAAHARNGRAHVVGHSLGGALSLHLAHRHPERVDRLVLVDAAGILLVNLYTLPKARFTLPEVGLRPVDRVLRRMDANLNAFSRGAAGRIEHKVDIGGWLRRNPAFREALFGQHTQVSTALDLAEQDFGAAIRETRAPTTLIWGRDDTVAPLRIGRLLEAGLPDARLHVIDDAGHAPMVQQPEAFAPLLWAALAEPLPPRQVTAEPTVNQGDVRCSAELDVRHEGRYGHVDLENCHGVVIANARLDRLTMRNSSVTLENVTIQSSGIGIDAHRSELRATGLRVSARVALRGSGSLFDLAGARIEARERAVELVKPSWVYFSVSEIDAPDHRGGAHLAWPVTVTRQRRR